ncbi:cyclopropane-fatty-acyl-phospholipid synthase [Testicularia cyperi]|uniref:Cyclopropane-fatty-acyl-phospholipid synthase n=1 Tax=Testicularia cyperi TaxID=1882483 RepID=A0A317XRW7_9BASI|nr:cyclopropane-fatty-acyl-phospholipid synthase [Testicularia cyperi]
MSSLFPSIPVPQALISPLSRPVAAVARSSVLSLFSKLAVGQLEIRLADGRTLRYGDPTLVKSKEHQHKDAPIVELPADLKKQNGAKTAATSLKRSAPHAVLIVNSDNFWTRMFFGADLGFAEAFMIGEVDTPDLAACFEIFILNRSSLSNLENVSFATSLVSSAQALLNKRYANTKVGSLRNIGAHYDISNAMYKAFLSKDMTYSCAVFDTLDADVSGPSIASISRPALSVTDELEQAQYKKLELIIKRANIRPGDRVLEIGTGWGSFAMRAVQMTGCHVDSVTLSVEQKALAEQRIAEAGLSDHIKVHLMDYRDFPESWTDRFDRVCSIEMLEAVGIEFLSTYFACVDRVLKKDGGTAVFQCITMPESRFESYYKGVDFIRKWIFPGGVLPSVTSLVNGATDGSDGRLVLDTVVSIGPHYSRTLREWKDRFEANFDKVIRPALLRDHEDIRMLPDAAKEKEVEVFRKKWIYYFVYCEVGFTHRVIGDHILAFTREGNVTLPVCCG